MSVFQYLESDTRSVSLFFLNPFSHPIVYFTHVCRELSGSRLVRCYGNLYSQARVEALEKLDTLPQLVDAIELKSKILFSVVVVSIYIYIHIPSRVHAVLFEYFFFFFNFPVGVQIDAGHVEPKKRTGEEIVILPDAVQFGARRIRSVHLLVSEEDGGHVRFDSVHRGKQPLYTFVGGLIVLQ